VCWFVEPRHLIVVAPRRRLGGLFCIVLRHCCRGEPQSSSERRYLIEDREGRGKDEAEAGTGVGQV
jgi:hypothetical protein